MPYFELPLVLQRGGVGPGGDPGTDVDNRSLTDSFRGTAMHAIDNQFRAALAFAYTFVIARVLTHVASGHEVNVIAVVATYLLLGIAAVALRRKMDEAIDAKVARTLCYVTLGALAATAPEFW